MKIDQPKHPPPAKRIAILLPNLGGGGAERVALAAMAWLVARGHRVDLILIRATGELLPLVPAGVRLIDLDAHRLIAALPQLVRYLRQERPDSLLAVMWPVTVVAIIAHRLAGSRARLVASDQNALSRQIAPGPRRQMLKWTTKFFYPLADARIHCSHAAAADLAALSGVARDRFEVIYNPIVPPQRIATTPAAEARWGGPGPRIITAGSLKKQKNHALLIESFARLAHGDARLMILGEGTLRPQLERLASELGVAERVVIAGFVIDPWPYLASADVFVLSSDHEGFPLALAEAMQAGLKVVSTDCVSGPTEMLDGGRFGRLVPCGDADALAAAIDAALAEPAEPQRMRARAEEMSGPAMIARYADLLTA